MNILIKNIKMLINGGTPKGDICISGNKILSAGVIPEGFAADKVIDGSDKLAIPGLINCHTHTYMSLFRNLADDLSFEEYELEYKYLKAIIEGGLGIKPQNVLIYATSNRRHLIREKFSDKRELDDDLHSNDTVQEKLSLVARFGVTIYYGSPDKKEFQNIVRVLADKYHIHMPEADLLLEANRWELSHGGLSGRTATQFIANLRSKLKGEIK